MLDVSLNELPRRSPEYLRTGNSVTLEMLIGNTELVTLQSCTQLGVNASRIVLGDEFTRMSDAPLGRLHLEARVIAAVRRMVVAALGEHAFRPLETLLRLGQTNGP